MSDASPEKITITPDTKLSKLLAVYPQLEEVLIEISPTFAKLKNPLLRRTVAKVATLQQVANVGEIPVSDLVNRLRKAVGVEEEVTGIDSQARNEAKPDWVNESRVLATIDADKILDEGKHPLEVVGSALKDFPEGDILKLTASFTPDPLIDKFKAKGYRIWTQRDQSGLVECFISKVRK